MEAPFIREATSNDVQTINDIYNHYVFNSTCTYQEQPEPIEARREWFARHDAIHPVLVATNDREVIGWADLHPFNPRSGYRFTVESGIYIRHDCHRRGIGSALLTAIIERARQGGFRSIMAGIDASQTASRALHAKHGFVQVAYFTEVGFKFGKWLDVVWTQKMLTEHERSANNA